MIRCIIASTSFQKSQIKLPVSSIIVNLIEEEQGPLGKRVKSLAHLKHDG